jgi:hypothetical protein
MSEKTDYQFISHGFQFKQDRIRENNGKNMCVNISNI